MDVFLELSLVILLLFSVVLQFLRLLDETILSQLQVTNDQLEILGHSLEVLDLLVHLGSLLIQLLNSCFSRTNLSFQLFDLVVQHKLKLFEFLSFLVKLCDFLFFVCDGGITLVELTFLTLLQLTLVSLVIQLSVKLLLHLVNAVLERKFGCILVSMVILNEGQVGLLVHTLVNLIGELLLVLLLNGFYFLPLFVLDLGAFFFVPDKHSLDVRRQLFLLLL